MHRSLRKNSISHGLKISFSIFFRHMIFYPKHTQFYSWHRTCFYRNSRITTQSPNTNIHLPCLTDFWGKSPYLQTLLHNLKFYRNINEFTTEISTFRKTLTSSEYEELFGSKTNLENMFKGKIITHNVTDNNNSKLHNYCPGTFFSPVMANTHTHTHKICL